MSVKIEQPYPVFRDKIGLPLDGGLIYIGVAGLNPETNPIQCYFDEDFMLLAPQPLRTINGYISRNGSPANIFLKVDECSITIKDRFRITQYTDLKYQLSNFGKPTTSQIIDESGLTQQEINNLIKRSVSKKTINISEFGNTGTLQNGSTEAWDNAIAYLKTVCPLVTSSIGQSWFDLSEYEFISNETVCLNNSLKLRSLFGVNIRFNIALSDDFSSKSAYAIDSSLPVSNDPSLNRRPFFIKIYGNIRCRFKGNGIYMHDFLHCIVYGSVSEYFSKGIATGTSGNELIIMPQCIINQWLPIEIDGRGSLPDDVVDGIGIEINCGDCVVLGIVATYFTTGIYVNARSAYIGSGCHIYGDGAQALVQTLNGGNLLIDGVWFDSSRVQLTHEVQVRNSRFYVYDAGQSQIGVVISGGRDVTVKGCIFLGSSDGTAVYRDAEALSERTCIVNDNEYWNNINNSEIRNLSPNVIGITSAGTCNLTESTGSYTYDGKWVSLNLTVAWNSHTGTGELAITGLPYSPSPSLDYPMNFIISTSSLTSVTVAYAKADSGQIRLKAGAVPFNVSGNGTITISGRYRAQ